MNIRVYSNYDALSRAAAEIVADQVRRNLDSIIGLATGSTPLGAYEELRKLHLAGNLDFSHITTYNLDEYVGLGADDPESYHAYMWRVLFGSINVDPGRVHIPPGRAVDLGQACRDYERAIEAAGGIDLQLLGIGRNGHMGFNEPGSELLPETHLVTLSDDTRQANARFFGSIDRVPHQAITMGVGTIMKAKQILLLASGADKAQAVREMAEGPVTPQVPASVLRMHRSVALLLDEAAADLLTCRAQTDAQSVTR